ncbi:PQQ-binding-like beta-propeller repeat protein [Micromonospora sagamiensis]|uniref:Putative pyrroloquinoline-quinone binding quinoprotein n=2 Tax=Micromonospora sagamiensis TaxID=47875 RepID=A0A562WHK1_9ACTN|nr:PQQ-binding-like beta-propeller repeat protein [Micromonospora sagamiensis]TWJ29652.1 putative pyrroloquinoline-quinone binding quinoprotein [Micromonospora sagamiensis]BCL17316.1 hypothetical protein GCM10017556_50550 [Micromonospora sagamiensis]
MSPSYCPSRWCLAGVALSLVVGLTACTRSRAEPEQPTPQAGASRESGSGQATRLGQEGPASIWSVSVNRVREDVARVGQVIVVPDERELRAVDRLTGQDRWRRPFSPDYRYSVTGDLIVVIADEEEQLEVLDAATGATRWRAGDAQDVVVHQRAVYHRQCVGTGSRATCALVARDPRDGRQLWKLPAGRSAEVSDEALGGQAPYAPPATPYVAVRLSDTTNAYTTVAVTTGRAGAGRLPNRAWGSFVAGDLLVTTDNSLHGNGTDCTVVITTVNAATGARRWSGEVFSGRTEKGECAQQLAHDGSGQDQIGTGTRLVAVTASGEPQLVDLRTGRRAWESATSGVPIAGNDRSVLIRHTTDAGELTLLDMATGASRWTAPDPGLAAGAVTWRAIVTDSLVAVSGRKDNRPCVFVYDVRTGHQLGRYPGYLAGAADDWTAVLFPAEESDGLSLDLHTF